MTLIWLHFVFVFCFFFPSLKTCNASFLELNLKESLPTDL